ncbi:G patch domain-containing protein 4 [Tribolium madens]|uniref:G patch domain-containing protein 4 n=1 Tax=Tribolium madens TaxID=41895 RepID=UPI001CF75A64|nr:G patch domain-containing protein 4 [Tribolium madens]
MDFAKKQLVKYGWKDGKGLGKNEDGISEALKPKLKFDNTGIGHEVGDQFTNNWWERVFNNAASNINVKVDQDEVKLHLKEESVEITTKNYSLKELKKNKHLEYGSFLKSAKLTGREVETYNVTPIEKFASCSSLTDDELFAACGGRTAHKGARHGLKLGGKLSRIEKQEKMLLKKMKNVSLTDDTSNLEKKIKKLKKHKEETTNNTSPQEFESPSSKKHKNKRKSVSFNDEAVVKYYTPEADTSHESIKEENSNNPVLADHNSNSCDEGIEQDFEDSNNDSSDHRSFEEAQKTFDDLSKSERKKLKKKRKLENKKTKTAQFIEDVREQMATEENCKKRKLRVEDVDMETKQNELCKYSKKIRKEMKREKKMMKSIVKSLDNFCKISDDE